MEALPNPYAHLSQEELTRLRYEKQQRYEQFHDMYFDARADWSLVMNALKGLHEQHPQQQPEQTRPLSA